MTSPPDAVPLPEGTVTVLSTDLVGSTAMNQRLGDEAATSVEREIETLALEQVEKQRGIVVKDTGDGLMVAFQSARRAVACAQEIQRAVARRNRLSSDGDVELRIGLHTGEVLSEDGNLHGETVILAKRVEESAPAGGIFASDTVRGVLGTARAELEDRGDFELKGITEPWHLFEVPWRDAEETGVLAARERTPFVGRAPERARLVQAAVRARDGAGALVFVAGEVGVGKTRLIDEAASEARKLGLRVLKGHCVSQQGAAPYLPWVELIEESARDVAPEALRRALGENAPEIAKLMPALRARYPDIPEPVSLPPEQERRYLLVAMTEFVERAARATPLMLVFEDLHWSDESTLLVLRQLAQRISEIPVLVIGSYRHTELEPGRALGELLPDLLRLRAAEEMLLGRLEQDGVTAMLQSRAGSRPPAELVSLVFAETEGNPFFVEEVFRHLNDAGKLFDERGEWRAGIQIADTEVPRGVGLVIGQRLERVSERCRKILTVAALVGRGFHFDLVAGVEGVDEDHLLDALEEAMGATLVEDLSEGRVARYGFVHEQIRQTLLSLLSTARRQRLHLRVADALEAFHGSRAEEHAAELAHHLYQSGGAADPGRTATWLTRAAARAVDALAFEDALRDLDAAAGLLEGGPPGDGMAEILRLRARALRGLGRIDEALSALADAIARAPEGPERRRAALQRAQLRIDLFRGREAMEDIESLLAAAREAGDREQEAELALMRGRAHYILSLDEPGMAGPTRAAYEEAYAVARELGDKARMARALVPTSWLTDYWKDYRPQALANNDEAIALANELGDEELLLEARTARMRLLPPGEAHEEALRIREVLEARRDPLRLKEHYFWLMWQLWMRGELDECVSTCDRGIELADQLGTPPVQYPTIKALALIDAGRPDEAWNALREEVADDAHPFGRCMQQYGVAFLLESLGAWRPAADHARRVLEEATRLSRTWMQSAMTDLIQRITARMGDGPEARELQAWLDARCAETGLAATALSRAEADLARGRAEQALEVAWRAADLALQTGQHRGSTVAVDLALRALSALGRWDEVIEKAALGLAHAEVMGARPRIASLRAARARAFDTSGRASEAETDRAAARTIWADMAARIGDPALRTAFERTRDVGPPEATP